MAKPRVKLPAGTRTDEAAGIVLGPLADTAEANVDGTLRGADPEALHDLRVAIRRARSVLRELKHVHDPDDRKRLRGELKAAQALTGPVRDLDVQLLGWDELVAPLTAEQAAALEPLRALLERRRAGERAQLERGLRDRRFAATLSAWRALAATPLAADGAKARPDAARPIEAVAGYRIRRVYRRMVRDGRRIDDDSPPEALHELRKRGKELRYLLELFGGPFPKDVVKPLVRTLKDLQDVLGRFQDRAVQVELLGGLREELDAPARAALEPALAALEADQRAARGEFATRFEPFAADEQRAVVRETFRAP